jgi:molybdenum cofactor synthesis domain-containing protein
VRAAVLTVSDSRSAGEAEDESGDRLAAWAEALGAELAGREAVPDEQEAIEARLRHWSDEGLVDLVLTTGGTGFAPRDVTPEATRAVIEREAPGIAEAMRLASRDHVRLWMVSRGVAGVRGATLIVNFPGSPKSIPEAGEAIEEALPHAVRLLRGEEH